MPKSVFIQLTTPNTDSDKFLISTNAPEVVATDVSKALLVAGKTYQVNDSATKLIIQSTSGCSFTIEKNI